MDCKVRMQRNRILVHIQFIYKKTPELNSKLSEDKKELRNGIDMISYQLQKITKNEIYEIIRELKKIIE